MNNKLTRTRNGMIAGVAEGIANYTEIDVTLIRLLFVIFTLAGGPGLIAYILLALLMPVEDRVADMINLNGDPVVPAPSLKEVEIA